MNFTDAEPEEWPVQAFAPLAGFRGSEIERANRAELTEVISVSYTDRSGSHVRVTGVRGQVEDYLRGQHRIDDDRFKSGPQR